MLKYLLTLIVLTHLTIYPQNNFNRVDSLLNAVKHMDIFSGVVLVAKGDKIKILKPIGYADEKKKIKLNTNTRFDRILYPFDVTRLLIVQLIQQGRLMLTDSIGKYIKMFNNNVDNNVTIKSIIGLSRKPPIFIDKEAIQRAIITCPFFIEPGKDTTHAVQTTIVMWRLIERITGKPYSVIVKKQIFDKVGMTESSAGYKLKAKNIARPFYNNLPDSELIKRNHSSMFDIRGIYTTARDFMKFVKSLKFDEKILTNKFKDLVNIGHKSTDVSKNDTTKNNFSFKYLYNNMSPLHAGYFDDDYSIVIFYNKWDEFNESSELLNQIIYSLLYPEKSLVTWPSISLILLGVINEKGIKYFKNNFDVINKTNPIKNPNTLNTLGDNLDKLNRFNDALEVYKINYNLYPNNEDANRDLGDIYIKLGQKELGQTYLDKADKLKKENKALGGSIKKSRK